MAAVATASLSPAGTTATEQRGYPDGVAPRGQQPAEGWG